MQLEVYRTKNHGTKNCRLSCGCLYKKNNKRCDNDRMQSSGNRNQRRRLEAFCRDKKIPTSKTPSGDTVSLGNIHTIVNVNNIHRSYIIGDNIVEELFCNLSGKSIMMVKGYVVKSDVDFCRTSQYIVNS